MPVLLRLIEEHDCCPKGGLEELCGDTSLNESPKLRKHEELQDLELHGSKMV